MSLRKVTYGVVPLVLSVLVWTPLAVHAQSFVPLLPSSVGGQPIAPGHLAPAGGTSLFHFAGQTWSLGGYTFEVMLYRTNPNVFNIPAGWGWTQGSMGHCAPQFGYGTHDDLEWVQLNSSNVLWWRGQCNGNSNPGFDPYYIELVRTSGGPNPPVVQADLPSEAPVACPNACGGQP